MKMKNIVYVKYSCERSEKFKIKTCIIKDGDNYIVEKSPLCSAAKAHTDNIYNMYVELCKNNLSDSVVINKCTRADDAVSFEYISGPTLEEKLDSLIDLKQYDELDKEMRAYFAAVFNVKNKVRFESCGEFEKVFGNVCPDGEYECAGVSNIDIIFGNVILNNGYNIIDYEWTFDFAVPFKYIIYRALSTYIIGHSKRRILLENGIYDSFDISDKEIAAFEEMERNFQKFVVGESFSTRAFYNDLKPEKHFVLDDVYVKERDRGLYAVDIYFDRGEGISGESDLKLYDVNDGGSAHFKVKVPENACAVRIDPVSECCIIEGLRITDENGSEAEYISNGCTFGDGCIVFADNDPNLLVKNAAGSIDVSYNIRVIAMEAAKSLCAEVESIREENSSLAAGLNERQGVVEQLNDTIRTYHAELENTRAVFKDTVSDYNARLTQAEKEIGEQRLCIEDTQNRLTNANNCLIVKDNIIRDRERQIDEILNSTCWKITAPLRSIIGGTKSFFRNNAVTGSAYEFLFYVKRDGLKGALEQRKINKRQAPVQNTADNDGGHISTDEKVYVQDIKPLEGFDRSIAVHLHLYYVDLLDEFFSYFNNIPYTFDLYVSCKGGSDIAAITDKFKKLKHVNKVDVRETINRGRDIAPLYVQFGRDIEKYDYFMHVHSKKSLFTGTEQYGWRQFNLDCLVGSEETVKRVFALFESDKRIGLFYPETFGEMHLIAQDWLANAYNGRKLLESFGIEFDDGLFNYPVGSFFWAKMDAVRPLFDRQFKYEDFPEEAGQTDGTIAHALERVIAFVTRSRGYREAIYDLTGGYVSIGKSYKVYQSYFKLDYEAAQYHLSLYDLVSFDIFDTLITRAVYQPDDVFRIMGEIIKQKYGIECNYLEMRKKAEAAAFEKKREYCSINDIYAQLPEVMAVDENMAQELKQLEIELELELCMPRRDMLKVFNHIKACGKKIVLVSDMYLTGDIVEKMLEKCGFTGYDDIWISCEKGARKDNDTIWKPFFDMYGQYNTVHVGDNPRSDIQIVGDKQRMTFFVINPRTAFKMSRSYNKFKKYINGSIADSLMLGLAVNGGIYNSPFAQNTDGEPVINDAHEFGFACFGPLLSGFCAWLNEITGEKDSLMFLAREGYLFEKLYNAFYEGSRDNMRKGSYFLTSRRAATVAAVKNMDDVKEIVSQYYRGSLSNMLRARLGIELFEDMTDGAVQMPEDADRVIAMLDKHSNAILEKAAAERESYKKYLDSVAFDENAVLVDVGYSGTIQYWLSKMTDIKLKGAYLCTWVDKKPERLGCECLAMYPVEKVEDEKIHRIFKNQLFLEAVLKAPFGQLICFEGDNAQPVYKNDSEISGELNAVQEGIIDYARSLGAFMDTMAYAGSVNRELCADIFDTFLEGDRLGEKIAKIMNVQDDYCSNGSQQFDAASKSWKVVQ